MNPLPPPGDEAAQLAAEAVAKLARWLPLFERRLAEAGALGAVPDLKDMTQFLTALKRSLEIARIAALLQPRTGSDDSKRLPLDPDALRQLLSEED